MSEIITYNNEVALLARSCSGGRITRAYRLFRILLSAARSFFKKSQIFLEATNTIPCPNQQWQPMRGAQDWSSSAAILSEYTSCSTQPWIVLSTFTCGQAAINFPPLGRHRLVELGIAPQPCKNSVRIILLRNPAWLLPPPMLMIMSHSFQAASSQARITTEATHLQHMRMHVTWANNN